MAISPDTSEKFVIEFNRQERIVDELRKRAAELEITPEQLIKRCIIDSMEDKSANAPAIPGETLDDFLVNNGVLWPAEE
ncbi:hypothetical protein [Marinobacter sp.]|uniref:hypothetical protein n=1 Tax=Marinobacter sp. TaxID=50741 RepID=UPI003A91FCAB